MRFILTDEVALSEGNIICVGTLWGQGTAIPPPDCIPIDGVYAWRQDLTLITDFLVLSLLSSFFYGLGFTSPFPCSVILVYFYVFIGTDCDLSYCMPYEFYDGPCCTLFFSFSALI